MYLGVFFAPLLVFFLVSGAWQTFDLHHASKSGGYVPPSIIKSFSQVHKDQRWVDGNVVPKPSMPFRWLIVLMSTGLLATTLLGIIMAFKYARGWIVWGCLLMGIVVPYFLLAAHR